jgi:hypothetical protein
MSQVEFMSEAPEEPAPTYTVEEIRERLAARIRSDSSERGRPTPVEELCHLEPPLEREEVDAHLTEMVKDERYQDIKGLMTEKGSIFLFSMRDLAYESALEKSNVDDLRNALAGRVRADSEQVRLTRLDALNEVIPELEPAARDEHLAAMAQDERYQDIQSLVGPTGVNYLFSERHITRHYATLMARAEANDPCGTIAATVRDESRIYPRPTKIVTFLEPVYGIDAGQLETYVEQVLANPEYKDIKRVVTSTGMEYLYSDLYLAPALAEVKAEDAETGHLRNP